MSSFVVPVVLIHYDTTLAFASTREIEQHFQLAPGTLDFDFDQLAATAVHGPIHVDIDPFSEETQGRRVLMYAKSVEDLDRDYLDAQAVIMLHRATEETIVLERGAHHG